MKIDLIGYPYYYDWLEVKRRALVTIGKSPAKPPSSEWKHKARHSPIRREKVEKVWRGCKYCDEEWGTCNPITNRFTMPPRGGIRFCPMCGRPLTDEAVQMVMKKLEALYE